MDEREYDTDNVSVTSTVSSVKEVEYAVRQVLAESEFEVSGTKYLIEWAGYPMHRCTWEPLEHIDSTEAYFQWRRQKARLTYDTWLERSEHNIAKFDTAVAKEKAAKDLRHAKRVKKRARLQKERKARKHVAPVWSDSDDDVPLLRQRAKPQQCDATQGRLADGDHQRDAIPQAPPADGDQSLFVPELPKHTGRRAPLLQSSSEEDNGGSGHDNGRTEPDSLAGDLRNRRASAQRTSRPSRGKERTFRQPSEEEGTAWQPSEEASTPLLPTKQGGPAATASIDPAAAGSRGRSVSASPESPEDKAQPKNPPRNEGSTNQSVERPQQDRTRNKDQRDKPERQTPQEKAQPNMEPENQPLQRKPAPQKAVVTPTGTTSTARRSTIRVNSDRGPLQAPAASRPSADNRGIKSGGKGSQPIKMVNEPKSALRREWQHSDHQYGTLKFRRRAEVRSREEGTPDPSALEFVNGPPPLPKQPPPAMNTTCPIYDSPYGLREPGQARRQEPKSSQESQTPVQTGIPLRLYEVNKIPLICFDWRNGHCPFPPDKCRFLHRDRDPSGKEYNLAPADGSVPPKYRDNPLTCWFWMMSPHGCRKTEDECKFAHKNTGMLAAQSGHGKVVQIDPSELPLSLQNQRQSAGFPLQTGQTEFQNSRDTHQQPSTFGAASTPSAKWTTHGSYLTCFFWNENMCKKSDTECTFQHRYTGRVADPPKLWKPPPGWKPSGKIRDEENTATTITATIRPVLTLGISSPSSTLTPRTGTINPSRAPDSRTPDALVTPSGSNLASIQASDAAMPYTTAWGQVDNVSPLLAQDTRIADAAPHSMINEQDTGVPTLAQVSQSPLIRSPMAESATSLVYSQDMKKIIEKACKLDFTEMFTYTENKDRLPDIDRRAFLIFDPEQHAEELDLVTRWLLIHHVEVCNFWSKGAWDHFKQHIFDGQSGIIIAHPDFEEYYNIPDFGKVLRGTVKLFSIGVQPGHEYDPGMSSSEPEYRYDRIEIFPYGGIIYITDDVFEENPRQALELINQFILKIESCRQVDGPIDPWKLVDDAFVPWRLAVRPELMKYLHEKCIQHPAGIGGQDPDSVSCEELYELLAFTAYIEPEDAELVIRPDDYYPIMSEHKAGIEDYYYSALGRSQHEANTKMVEFYAGVAVELRDYYRHYFVVHTDPAAVDWQNTYKNIDEVMTPEAFIECLKQPGKGNRFDFFEWQFPDKPRVDSAAA